MISSCLKPPPTKEPEEELKESFINLFHNVYTYLFECSRNAIDNINTEACWNTETTDVAKEEPNNHWLTNFGNKGGEEKYNKTQTYKTKDEFEEGIQRVAKATQDLTKEACRHMKHNVVKLNKKLERAIEKNRINNL